MSAIRDDISVYVTAPDCSCGHPQSQHYHPGMARYRDDLPGCMECADCSYYDGEIVTLGVGRSADQLFPAEYNERGELVLPPELLCGVPDTNQEKQ